MDNQEQITCFDLFSFCELPQHSAINLTHFMLDIHQVEVNKLE